MQSIQEILKTATKARTHLENLNLGEAAECLDEVVKLLGHPALRFVSFDDIAWSNGMQKTVDDVKLDVAKKCKEKFEDRVSAEVERLMIPYRADQAAAQAAAQQAAETAHLKEEKLKMSQ